MEQRHTQGHLIFLLARFPISGCASSLPLEWRRWQRQYRFCPGDGNVPHCHPWSTNTRGWVNTHAWGLHSACDCLGQHDGCCSSCCLSESKTESKTKSAKVIWNEIDSFFQTNCWRLAKTTCHYAWPHCSFSWSDCTCNHPPCCRTCCSLCLCSHIEGNCGINCLNEDSQIVNHRSCVGCFNHSCNIYDCNVDGILIYSYVWQEVELFSFPVADYLRHSSQEH